ncbi:MAG: hypothetical protein JO202_20220 [Ktedonobacteraceae bacterium]|nr:hypothetical protein [Ktedonobacteraceae bacterium]
MLRWSKIVQVGLVVLVCMSLGVFFGKSFMRKSLSFQAGIVFPQWGLAGYSSADLYWHQGLREIAQQTGASWVAMTIPLYQLSLAGTDIEPTHDTPTTQAVTEGIRQAKSMGYKVFVVPQITVGGNYPWAGHIGYESEQMTHTWFKNYWAAYSPYIEAASKAGADEIAIGAEYEQLELASPAEWLLLLNKARTVYQGLLTYDENWTALGRPVPSWMQSPLLDMIGVSVYIPLVDTPTRLAGEQLLRIWHDRVQVPLDILGQTLNKPVLISEVGYQSRADAGYQPWREVKDAPRDDAEQAELCNAVLANVMQDTTIAGVFFWVWSYSSFDLHNRESAHVLHRWYTSSTRKSLAVASARF